ncbi:MAG: methyltransferase domain-containing protein [Streptosporangiales bacterium]|nr:methyltransferase domain-containing protein [Streptosporangiales bacterium]
MQPDRQMAPSLPASPRHAVDVAVTGHGGTIGERTDPARIPRRGAPRGPRMTSQTREGSMGQPESARDHVIRTYRARARRYDITANLYYLLGYRQWAYRRRAVQALRLRPGGTVVEIGCGTGLNFSLIEQVIGPEGRIVGVGLTDAMLARAERRVKARGWRNVSLVQADAVGFRFPVGVDAILCTFVLSHVPECAEVIAQGCTALAPGGRYVVLGLKVPQHWLAPAVVPIVRPFGVTEEVMARRPWDVIRAAMQARLTDPSWTELFFGFAFLAAGRVS